MRPVRTLHTLLDKTSRYQPSAITVKQLVDFGNRRNETESYQFLHRELPIRLSHMIKELQMLPDNLLLQRSVKSVEDLYWKSFEDLAPFDMSGKSDDQTLSKFTRRLSDIKRRHSSVVETMAEGILALKKENGDRFDPAINYFLDRFYTSRIAIRVLISNHLVLFGQEQEAPGHCGVVDTSLDVHDIVDEAASTACYLCNHHYGECPPVQISTFNKMENKEAHENINIVYIASHLHHMVFELIKNSLRATVEFSTMDTPVQVLIVQGKRDISIKISDRGGGIPMRLLKHLFDYHYSTAPEPDVNSRVPPLAGFGYGLPLSRLYARYLNGNIRLLSMEGYGTDAIIYLQMFSEDAGEVLPLFNKTSQAKYQIGTMVQDWNVAGSSGSRPIWT